MAEFRLPLLAALAGLAWLGTLWSLGLYTDPAVRSWRRLARLRGLEPRPLGEQLGERLPLLRRLQNAADLGRLLAQAGHHRSPGTWLLRTAAQAGVALTAMLLLDEASLLASGRLFPLLLAPALAAGVVVLAYARLQRQAAEHRQRLELAVTDALPHLAVLTHHHRLPPGEALLLLARCQADRTLQRLVVDAPAPSTAAALEALGPIFGVPAFSALATAVRRVTEHGLASSDVYVGLARTTYAARLARARVAAAQARTLIVIPMGLMTVPVLVLIGGPLVASLAGTFAP